VKALVGELHRALNKKVTTAGLFGSFARGAAAAGSDIDLLVIVETLKERERLSALLSDKLPGFTERYGLSLQPVIFERRRLINESEGMRDFIEAAEKDWIPIAGMNIKQLLKPPASPKKNLRRKA
jgi:predicted nucleotidyltransferase